MTVEFKSSPGLVQYGSALAEMQQRVSEIKQNLSPELIWFLEHNPVYTAGTSAKAEELLNSNFPIHKIGRGGKYTYHGPGQLVGYLMLNLKKRQKQLDLRLFVHQLESWIIKSLADLGVMAGIKEGKIGIWVGEEKIGAIGVRVSQAVTSHGFALNLNPNLSHFEGIIPCGIKEFKVSSTQALGFGFSRQQLEESLRRNFYDQISC